MSEEEKDKESCRELIRSFCRKNNITTVQGDRIIMEKIISQVVEKIKKYQKELETAKKIGDYKKAQGIIENIPSSYEAEALHLFLMERFGVDIRDLDNFTPAELAKINFFNEIRKGQELL